MAQIGTIRIQTQNSGTVDVPVFDIGDSGSGVYEFLRVQTASGTGFIPVVDPAESSFPYLRVQSQNQGIVAVHNESSLVVEPWANITDNWFDDDENSYTTLATLNPDGDNREWHTLATGLPWTSSQEISQVSATLAESNDRNLRWWRIRITDQNDNVTIPTLASPSQVNADNGTFETLTKTFDNTGTINTSIKKIEMEVSNPSTQSTSDFRVHELTFDAEKYERYPKPPYPFKQEKWHSNLSSDNTDIQNWWNNNWTFKTTDATFGQDNSFKDNRFKVTNCIAPFADELNDGGSDTYSYFEGDFDLTDYDTMQVWGKAREDGQGLNDMETVIRINNSDVVRTTTGGWIKHVVDISGYSGTNEIELGVYNNRGAGLDAEFSEFYLY